MENIPALWIVIAGLVMIVAGPGAAKKVLSAPVKIIGKLVTDLVAAVLRFAFDLLGQGMRAGGRQINRGARHLLGLPPPPPPRRKSRRHSKSESDEDEDDEDEADAAA